MKITTYIFLLSFTLIGNIAISQNSKAIDSLNRLLTTQKGINLAKTYNELAWKLRKTDDTLAIQYAEQAKIICISVNNPLELATSHIRLGTLYLNRNTFEKAENHLLEALTLEKKERNQSGIARAKIQLGKLHKKIRNYEKALTFYKESIAIRQKQGNEEKRIARLYNNIARIYEAKNEPDKALNYYYKSISIRDSIQDKKGLIKSYKNIGLFYINQKKYTQAIINLKKGHRICINTNDSIQLASIKLNIGVSYNSLNKPDSALTYFNQSLYLKERFGLKDKEAVYNNIGLIKKNQQNYQEAMEYFTKSITIAIQNNNEEQLVDTYHNIGKNFSAQKKYRKAIDHYLLALKLSQKYKREYRSLDILSSMGKSYELLEDFQNANFYNEKHISLRNQLELEKRKSDAIVDQLNQEQTALKIEKQTLQANNEVIISKNKTKTTLIIALIISSILLSLLFFTIFKNYKIRQKNKLALQNEKIKQGKIEQQLKIQELKSINAMIDGQEKERKRIAQDLHDRLGSMLSVVKIHYNSIEDSLEKMKTDSKAQYEKANSLLDEACVAVREISHDMVSGVLTKFGLIPALQELKTNLETTGTPEIELIDYGFDDRIPNKLEINIYRIIQELVGNILKHAEASEISIQLLKKGNHINITIFDNGKGFNTELIGNFSGMGIKGIQSRVENLNGEIQFDSCIGKGTTITIDIAINNQTLNL